MELERDRPKSILPTPVYPMNISYAESNATNIMAVKKV